MEATTASEYRAEKLSHPATPEEIWAILWEISESRKAYDRKMQEEAEARAKAQEAQAKAWAEAWEARARAQEAQAKAQAEAREAEAKAQAEAREAEAKARAEAQEAQAKARAEAQEAEAKAREELDRRFKETERLFKELRKQQKRTGRQMGLLSNRFGELAEHLVAPRIHARFNERGYFFGEMATKGAKISGEDGKTKAEIDILMQNGEIVMAVEVKAKPAVKDVEHHIKRLEILRDYYRKRNDLRKIQGAIAGAIFGSEEKKAVIEAGLYVIEQSGDTMKIEVPDGFVPREW
jgi:multidrug efflux pump subunit AcrA (membrane-fusion protein)